MEMELGDFQVNFNEGSSDTSNTGIRDDYQLLDVILNYFPPEDEEKSSVIPLIFSCIIAVVFLWFVISIYSNGSNLSNMTIWGFLFTLTYMAIILIIVAFWIQINLINTLWMLLAMTPITLFMMNKGLTPDNCQIPPFKAKSKHN